MKKTLALVLALAMVFSTITVAFAEGTLSAEAQIAADLGMLKGETGTVDAAYTATAPSRLQSAVMFLRLKGLEAEALAFTGEANFADGNIAWAEGSNLLAYLKANPQLGWAGDGTNFNPENKITAKEYYKVLLEALGYKQTVTGVVVGDFTWDNVLEFAALKGLSKVAAVTNYTVNDLAIATVEALKLNVKDGDKTLVATLVAAGKVDEAKAVAAGLITASVAAEVKSAKALGNSIVEVTFTEDIDAAGNAADYAIEGLEVTAAVVSGADTVRLTTAAQSVGKVYLLTVGEKTVKFTGIAKVSDGPVLTDAVAEDVEEVVLTFDRFVDFETASNVANYTIAGVEIASAEVDDQKVTLTTVGLKDSTTYKVKAANIKSIDGVLRKATTFEFKSDYDTAAPRISGDVVPETNQRFLLYFDEPITEESAEDLANYSIVDEDGTELEIVSVTWNTDSADTEDNIEVITAAQEDNEEYTLKVSNIADQRKVANVMTRTLSEKFEGMDEDTEEPDVDGHMVLSKNKIILYFSDDSKLDEASVLSTNSYTLTDDDDNYMDVDSVETLTNKNGEFEAVLTVEDLVDGERYNLNIVDILDEFGNSLEEADEVITPSIDPDFSDAVLTDFAFAKKTDETTEVVLTFDMPLIEATAENIAAYSLNNDGGAPTKATYKYDSATGVTTVTLIFNELVNGKDYKLTVDGVEDLAGNVLKFVTGNTPAEADDPADDWDTTAPKLKKAYALNKYVAALEFNEEVTFGDDVKVQLTDGTIPFTLDAKVTSEDDTVIEFSYKNGANWVALDPAKEYTVVDITYSAGEEITDLMGTPLAEIPADLDDFKGDVSEPDYAEVNDIEMINGGAFEITMSRNVVFRTDLLIADSDADGDINDETYDLDASTEITIDDNVITVAIDGGLDKEDTVVLDLNAFVTDEHGMAVINDDVDDANNDGDLLDLVDTDETVLESNITDEKAPIVDNVKALDRRTVEIEFSEDIKTVLDKDDFDIFNEDDDDARINVASFTIDGNLVTLTLSDSLEGRYEYNLQVVAGNAVDYAGNAVAEDLDLYFDGSDKADH